MTEVYRKWGRVVRYENGVTISASEAGEAFEKDGVFQARPAGNASVSPAVLHERAGRPGSQEFIEAASRATIERLIITAGTAIHETNGRKWTEESRRVHLGLINTPLRALIDLASFDVTIVGTIAEALARAGGERDAPKRIRLAANVSAAILPSLIGELAMEQTGGGFDGRGQRIETRAVTHDAPPNWYRPGYAIRPVRAWLNIRALPFGRIDRDAPLAIAMLEPVHGTNVRVLCVDGDDVFPTTIDASHIAAVSDAEAVWYPYAAGSFGVEMML
jgi:hypothetical protein